MRLSRTERRCGVVIDASYVTAAAIRKLGATAVVAGCRYCRSMDMEDKCGEHAQSAHFHFCVGEEVLARLGGGAVANDAGPVVPVHGGMPPWTIGEIVARRWSG